MKKILSVFLFGVLLFSLLACSKTSSSTESTSTGTAKEKTTEYMLEKEEGCNLLTLYIRGNSDMNTETSDCWMWWDSKEGSGYPLYECDYGFKCMVNVPEGIESVGFIFRTDCSDPCGSSWGEATKDYASDQYASITGENTVYYLNSGSEAQYTSTDGGKTLTQITSFTLAAMIGFKSIQYFISPAVKLSADDIKLYCEGELISVDKISSLNTSSSSGVLTVNAGLDISKKYTVSIEEYGEKSVVPTKLFDTAEFINNYTYDGDDLGANVTNEGTVFKLWAPTASSVVLNLFTSGDTGSAYKSLPMEKAEKGVWTLTDECGSGTYYTYTVTTSVGSQETVDPYAKAAGLNGNRGMVIDLSLTDPSDWENDTYNSTISTYQDAIIWEAHVRDFSNNISSSKYKGKYLAFTETGLKNSSDISVGIDYLKNLGITHIHMQPVYDFATTDEATANEFNWGYDPKNYNVPEGSYSTDPYHGEVRINEFKQMVQSIHNNGMGMIMDVVYNHTYDANSCLNKCVPYYYYRYTSSGENGGGSGCGNETASERLMYSKYMIDSVTYWAKEYHVDGFRFDLMALHDINTMKKIEAAVHEINPKAIIYGEGWTGGTSEFTGIAANQLNIKKIEASIGAAGSVAVFNDSIRDGLKGSVFTSTDQGYVNGNATKSNAQKVIFGILGGASYAGTSWYVNNSMVINYVSCHDNLTLYDKLKASCPTASEEEIVEMNKLTAAIIMISKGTPFMLAGEEMLRSKSGNSNSYNASDSVNNIKWESLTESSYEYVLMNYYKDLISLRKNNDFIKYASSSCTILDSNVIKIEYRENGSLIAMAFINPLATSYDVSVDNGTYQSLMDNTGITSGNSELTIDNGSYSVNPKSVLFIKLK